MPRRLFLRKEEEDATRGRSDARAKSSERAGLLGWDIVEEVVSVGTPLNWAARSLYCCRRVFSFSCSVVDALGFPSVEHQKSVRWMPTLILLLLANGLVRL